MKNNVFSNSILKSKEEKHLSKLIDKKIKIYL